MKKEGFDIGEGRGGWTGGLIEERNNGLTYRLGCCCTTQFIENRENDHTEVQVLICGRW